MRGLPSAFWNQWGHRCSSVQTGAYDLERYNSSQKEVSGHQPRLARSEATSLSHQAPPYAGEGERERAEGWHPH